MKAAFGFFFRNRQVHSKMYVEMQKTCKGQNSSGQENKVGELIQFHLKTY